MGDDGAEMLATWLANRRMTVLRSVVEAVFSRGHVKLPRPWLDIVVQKSLNWVSDYLSEREIVLAWVFYLCPGIALVSFFLPEPISRSQRTSERPRNICFLYSVVCSQGAYYSRRHPRLKKGYCRGTKEVGV